MLTVSTRDLCALIEAVMVLGWLRECEAEDRAQVGAAIGALLEEPTFEELFAEPIVRLFTARDGVLELFSRRERVHLHPDAPGQLQTRGGFRISADGILEAGRRRHDPLGRHICVTLI